MKVGHSRAAHEVGCVAPLGVCQAPSEGSLAQSLAREEQHCVVEKGEPACGTVVAGCGEDPGNNVSQQ